MERPMGPSSSTFVDHDLITLPDLLQQGRALLITFAGRP